MLKEILEKYNIEDKQNEFEAYCRELLKTNEVMNLTAICDEEEIYSRHFADSLALLDAYNFTGKRVIDVGCGAGFPGLPLLIARDDIRLTLLDALAKRVDFLNGVCAALSLSNAECIHGRAEELAAKAEYREGFDIAVSRAVADLRMLSELTLPFVSVGGALLAMKAKNCEEELKLSENAIKELGGELESRFDYKLFGTDIIRTVLIIRKTAPTDVKYPRRFAKIKSKPL